MRIQEADERRFWAKVALPNEQGCMLWLDKPRKDGYGQFKLANTVVLAHRVSYIIAYGEIPAGLQIDHVKVRGCTNRHCVAPEHLEAVTQQENIRRGDAGINHSSRTQCPQGHEYTSENTYLRRRGGRDCRTCRRERNRQYRARRAA